MNRIWPNGKTKKEELTRRLDRAEQLLREHEDASRPLRYQCANHFADVLGSPAKCLLDSADQALDAAEKAAAETKPGRDDAAPYFHDARPSSANT